MEWTPEREALLMELRAQGLSFGACAKRLGMSRSAVAGKCDRIKHDAAPRPRPKRVRAKPNKPARVETSANVTTLSERDLDAFDLDILACLDRPPRGMMMTGGEAVRALTPIWGGRVEMTRNLIHSRKARILAALEASEA